MHIHMYAIMHIACHTMCMTMMSVSLCVYCIWQTRARVDEINYSGYSLMHPETWHNTVKLTWQSASRDKSGVPQAMHWYCSHAIHIIHIEYMYMCAECNLIVRMSIIKSSWEAAERRQCERQREQRQYKTISHWTWDHPLVLWVCVRCMFSIGVVFAASESSRYLCITALCACKFSENAKTGLLLIECEMVFLVACHMNEAEDKIPFDSCKR